MKNPCLPPALSIERSRSLYILRGDWMLRKRGNYGREQKSEEAE